MQLACDKPLESQLPPKRQKRKHVRSRPQLLTRDMIDGRSNAGKLFTCLVDDIQADLGGRDRLSRIELALVEAFSGACGTISTRACCSASRSISRLTKRSNERGRTSYARPARCPAPLANVASISLTASVSVMRCTAEISRDSRSSAAS
jgi:hypothetical protein